MSTLTTNLRLELERTNTSFNRWSQKKVDDLTLNKAIFDQQIEECDHTIRALKENNVNLDDVREYNNELKEKQKGEIDHYVAETERLKASMSTWEKELRKYELEEAQETNRLGVVREEHDTARERIERSLNDLTHGIRLYSSLGLEFQKSENESMKFVFTQINEAEPFKEYFFVMFVDENDSYKLIETSPKLPSTVTSMHINALNKDNHIGRFVVMMRQAFKASL